MTLPQCSHITRKRGVYYFRQRLPCPGVGEVAVSLSTRNFREAEHLAERLAAALNDLFSEGMYDSAKIAAVLRAERSRMMDEGRRKVIAGAYGLAEGHGRAERSRKALAEAEGLAHGIKLYEMALRTRDLSGPEPIIRRLMAEHGLPEGAFGEFGLGYVQASLETLRRRRDWLEHGLVDFSTPEPQPVGTSAAESLPVVPEAPKLSEVLPRFVGLMQETQGWRGQTLAQNQATYRMFTDHCGDRPVTDYGRRDLSSFYEVLRRLPALYSKSSEWRGLSLADIAAKSEGRPLKRLEMKTVKRHFSALGVLFGHLRERGDYTADNPAYGFSFPTGKTRANEGREMWEGEALAKLFASPVWSGCASIGRRTKPGSLVIKDEKFWLPLLGLYHGNRLEEFAQLHRSDVRQM